MSIALYRLLATCARARCDPTHYRRIADAAEHVSTWESLAALAQAHGLASLVHAHLRGAHIALPPAVQRELNALALQNRLAAQIQMRALRDILREFQNAGIRVVVLKGAALRHILYSAPDWRPMSDLDLLVSRSDLKRAQALLSTLGFNAPLTFAGHHAEHRHLSAATRTIDGLQVQVELHHNLFEPGASPILMDVEHLPRPLVSFALDGDGLLGWTLGYEDQLWHLCQHLIESTNVFSAVSLMWVADIVGCAEQFCAQIDWAWLARHYPIVMSTLALLHFIAPLSADLIRQSGIAIGKEPRGLWNDFEKLPRTTPEDQLQRGYRPSLRRALAPSDWWLRLHYGLGSAQPLRWQYRLAHAAYLTRRFVHVRQRQARADELPISLE